MRLKQEVEEVQVLESRDDLELLVNGDLVNVDFPQLRGVAKVELGNNGVLWFISPTDGNKRDYWTKWHLKVADNIIYVEYDKSLIEMQ